jgi:methionine synthase II (cobalamin-independent)
MKPCIAYITGGTANAKWNFTSDYETYEEAEIAFAAVTKMGYKALLTHRAFFEHDAPDAAVILANWHRFDDTGLGF